LQKEIAARERNAFPEGSLLLRNESRENTEYKMYMIVIAERVQIRVQF